MLKVELVTYDDLTDEEKSVQPNNGCGKKRANYVKITDSGKTLIILSDAVEPEDATFRRDFKNVIKAIKLAYKTGIKHGKKLGRRKGATN